MEMGIVNVVKKVNCIVNGIETTCYQMVNTAIGFKTQFANKKEEMFVSLSINPGSILALDYNKNEQYLAVNFTSLNKMTQNNNSVMNIKFFMEQKSHDIGNYYEFDKKDGVFYEIDNKSVTKVDNKEYDGNVLNKDSDISDMYSKIKETIISQDEQIMQILTSLFKNQKTVNSTLSEDLIAKLKENIIIYGSTGTGKTEILKRIANIYKIPIVIEDSTSLSETGYVGRKITDMLEDLYLAAGKDIEVAQKGILVLDEFDKLAEKNISSDHVSRIGVQRSLLKLLDGSTFYMGDKKFDTSKLSIVALGAFMGIANNDDYSKITSKDFVDYGIMRELMGRFSKYIAMNPLNKEDIKKILVNSDFSPLHTYKELFDTMNIKFSYDESFVDYIADKTILINSGARSIKTVVDNEIGSAMFRIFAGEYSAIHLTRPKNGQPAYVLAEKIVNQIANKR